MYGRYGVPNSRVQLNSIYGNKKDNTPPTNQLINFSVLKSLPIFSKIRERLNKRTIPQALFIQGEPIETRYQRQSSYSDRLKNEIRIIEVPTRYK